ncbi:uncharacterized protein B0H18DRAFT_957741 [Fomitopsis serialis]|uniref:uncharacterized protein n=1 Tax=Fomitopsis serialis TaxID=139415 RepID=UPI00200835AE|nr:uncharacterized protein B0H18DRAFT_957741 [Neoantrodia serialis]KAH9918980.1 hypothetical protein B0H18DRAFT_957741 [Neoantrodia serialis]
MSLPSLKQQIVLPLEHRAQEQDALKLHNWSPLRGVVPYSCFLRSAYSFVLSCVHNRSPNFCLKGGRSSCNTWVTITLSCKQSCTSSKVYHSYDSSTYPQSTFEYNTDDSELVMTRTSPLHQDAIHSVDAAGCKGNGGHTLGILCSDGHMQFKIPDLVTSIHINPPCNVYMSDGEVHNTNVDIIEFEACVCETMEDVFEKVKNNCTEGLEDSRKVYQKVIWIIININESACTTLVVPNFKNMDQSLLDYKFIPSPDDESHILFSGVLHGLEILLRKVSAELYLFHRDDDLNKLHEGVCNHWGPEEYIGKGHGVCLLPKYNGQDELAAFLPRWAYTAGMFHGMGFEEWQKLSECPTLNVLHQVEDPLHEIIEAQGAQLTAEAHHCQWYLRGSQMFQRPLSSVMPVTESCTKILYPPVKEECVHTPEEAGGDDTRGRSVQWSTQVIRLDWSPKEGGQKRKVWRDVDENNAFNWGKEDTQSSA